MRGEDQRQAGMYSYVTMEQRIAADHPAQLKGEVRSAGEGHGRAGKEVASTHK
jgi:hypothetical protein